MYHPLLPSLASIGWSPDLTERPVVDPTGRLAYPISCNVEFDRVYLRYLDGSIDFWSMQTVALYQLAEPTPQPKTFESLADWEAAPTNTTISTVGYWLRRVATRLPSGEWAETGCETFYTTAELYRSFGPSEVLVWGRNLDI